jgi:Micrococcal nuclease (thermonuclease) homologs
MPSAAVFNSFLVALLLAGLLVRAHATSACAPDQIDERVSVTYVYDGDTVQIEGRRKVRIIGVDTPEFGHKGEPPAPFAVQARESLRDLLNRHGNTLSLRHGAQSHDSYGRLLAHAYVGKGESVAAWLLAQGLGATLAIPPNLWNLECYQAAEKRARVTARGIWQLPTYQPIESTALTFGTQGYRIVQGRVQHIGTSPSSVWLNLTGDLALRISRDDLQYFGAWTPEGLLGRRVRARGWIHASHGKIRMRVLHPTALETID